MTIISMENRKTLVKEILNERPETTLIQHIRKSDDAALNAYLSRTRLDVIDVFDDVDEMGRVDQDKMIEFFDDMNDKQLLEFHRHYQMGKLEEWCSASGDCDLYDSLIIKERLLSTGVAMTAAKQIMASSTNAIQGLLSNPQAAITDAIKTEITTNPSPSYGNWLAIGALTTLTALGFMIAYRHEIRRGYNSLTDSINQRLFAHTPNTDEIDDYKLGAALHRL
jgi:hypothetical protein